MITFHWIIVPASLGFMLVMYGAFDENMEKLSSLIFGTLLLIFCVGYAVGRLV